MKDDPRLPTSHLAGSPQKVEILRRRAALRLPLFLPGDAVGIAGYVGRGGGKHVLNHTTAALLAAVIEMRGRGMTYRAIGAQLGIGYSYVHYLVKVGRRSSA